VVAVEEPLLLSAGSLWKGVSFLLRRIDSLNLNGLARNAGYNRISHKSREAPKVVETVKR